MRRVKRKIAWTFALLLAAIATFLVPTVWFKPWSLEHYYARVFLEYALRHPMMLTSIGILDGTPLDFHSGKLDDMSLAFEDREARFLKRQIRILRSYDPTRLGAQERLSYDVLDWFLSDQEQNDRFRHHDYPVNQLFGIQSGLPDFMMNLHPMKRRTDAENYVRRISRFGVAFDQVLEGLRKREAMGIVPPRFVIHKVLEEMRGFVSHPPRENPLYTSFAAKLDSIPKLDRARRDSLKAHLESAIEITVYPAYRRLIVYEEALLEKATDDDGVWKLPQGDAYYDRRLQTTTTTHFTADSIHALGRHEVDRIQAEMRRVLAGQEYHGSDLAATMRRVLEEPRFQFAAGDSGRQAILARYEGILEDADRRMGSLFGRRPRAALQVKRVPEFKEATAPGAYYQRPDMTGSRPGIFYANLRDPGETQRPEMRTLAYHEGIPGHHFQLAIQNELKGVPFFRRMLPFTAYAEGWGLYAERLAYENGFHQDAYDSLGALQAELFRAVRLVVDTGIHRKRWTRQQAIDYMVSSTGMQGSKIITEVERYIVNPGQACAYKVGQLQLLELRERARARLGARFDIRRFHDVVLGGGALPLSLVERVVDEWIESELRRPSAGQPG